MLNSIKLNSLVKAVTFGNCLSLVSSNKQTKEKIAMTRKDYVLIAKALRENRKLWEANPLQIEETVSVAMLAIDGVVDTLANRLAEENPRFDRAKFVEASKLESRGNV